MPWRECVARYDRPNTLFYLDPPYWKTAVYGVDFGLDQHRELARAMATIKGRAVLSINDHPTMREVYGAFRSRRLKTTYTVGGNHCAKQATELLMTTW